ncbi:MAG: hypothetical protein DCC49_01175 [Acidobacteria bacterium]|nr:MAG: hypothetical protein DCC49_01175 [Acidobacteriota bacterium]
MTMHEIPGRVPIKTWIEPDKIEEQALNQLKNTAEVPHVWPHLAVMPDVHYGLGATIGSVVPMRDAICPAAVGVDIGCGMAAIKTNLGAKDLPDDLSALRSDIEAAIPVGFSDHKEPVGGYWASSAFAKTPLTSHVSKSGCRPAASKTSCRQSNGHCRTPRPPPARCIWVTDPILCLSLATRVDEIRPLARRGSQKLQVVRQQQIIIVEERQPIAAEIKVGGLRHHVSRNRSPQTHCNQVAVRL